MNRKSNLYNPSHKSNNKVSNNKLKTLPNQIVTNAENTQHFFKSACDDLNPNICRLNLASPTFATEVAFTSISGQTYDNQEFYNKQNNCLRDISNNIQLDKSSQGNKKKTIAKKLQYNQNCSNNGEQPYSRVLQKCGELEQQNNQLKQTNKMITKKLKASQKALQNKLEQAQKFSQANNTSKQLSNIDIYLQLQAFRYDYKECKKQNQALQRQLKQSKDQVEQLSQSMNSFINKQQTLSKKDKQQLQKVHKKYKEQIQEITNKYEDMLRENNHTYATDCEQKEEVIQKIGRDYQKIKFLKQEIEKKRHEDIQLRQQTINQFKALQLSKQNAERDSQHTINKLKQQITELKKQYTQKQNIVSQISQKNNQLNLLHQKIEQLTTQLASNKLQFARLNSQYTQLQKIKTNIQQQHKKLHQLSQQNKNNKQKILSALEEQNNQLKQNDKQLRSKIQLLQQQVQITQSQCGQLQGKFEEWLQTMKQQKIKTDRIKCLENQLQEYQKNCKQLTEKNQELVQILGETNRSKQELEGQVDKYREDYQRANSQLESSYRKLEQYQEQNKKNQQYYYNANEKKTKGSYELMIKSHSSNNNGLSTKSISQLQMIRNTLSLILNSRNSLISPSNSNIINHQQLIISELVQLSEQCADYFDELIQQSQQEKQNIKTKQQIISKVLKFVPEEERKKRKILQYLRIMDNLRQFSIEEVNRINVEIRQEYQEWSARVKSWKINLQNLEEQNLQMRKLLRNYNINPNNNNNSNNNNNNRRNIEGEREKDKWETRGRRYIMD